MPGTSGIPMLPPDKEGSTFFEIWQFTSEFSPGTDNLKTLTLEGLPGNTIFDRCRPDDFGMDCGTQDDTNPLFTATPGSQLGISFNILTPISVDVEAIYSRNVALEGQGAMDDVWHTLTINFKGIGLEGNFDFEQDTDNAVVAATPEPSSLALFALGMAGLGLFGRKRRGGSQRD